MRLLDNMKRDQIDLRSKIAKTIEQIASRLDWLCFGMRGVMSAGIGSFTGCKAFRFFSDNSLTPIVTKGEVSMLT